MFAYAPDIEELFKIVESDFRETLRGGRTRNNKPVTEIERYEFKKALHKIERGTLRWLLLIYLRTYDSLQDMLAQKNAAADEETEGNSRRVPGQFHHSPGASEHQVSKIEKPNISRRGERNFSRSPYYRHHSPLIPKSSLSPYLTHSLLVAGLCQRLYDGQPRLRP